MTIVLDRLPNSSLVWGIVPTLGYLHVDKEVIHTVELPWRQNERNVSAIPPGRYKLAKNADKGVIEVLDVPGRTGIQIHPANWCHELKGCIGVGMDFNGTGGVQESRKAMGLLLEMLPDTASLVVK